MKTINVYLFNELSHEAKQNAIKNCQNKFETDLDFFYDDCIEKIEEKGFFGNIRLNYSLGYCQGDGLNFSCEYFSSEKLNKIFENILGEGKQKTIDAIINNSYFKLNNSNKRYCYASTKDLDYIFDDNIDAPNIEEVVRKVEDKLKSIYIDLCRELELNGYNEIEYQGSYDYIANLLEENEYEFLENGQII